MKNPSTQLNPKSSDQDDELIDQIMQEANGDITSNKRSRTEEDESPDAKKAKVDEAYGDDDDFEDDEFSGYVDSSQNHHEIPAEDLREKGFGVDHEEFLEELRGASNDDEIKNLINRSYGENLNIIDSEGNTPLLSFLNAFDLDGPLLEEEATEEQLLSAVRCFVELGVDLGYQDQGYKAGVIVTQIDAFNVLRYLVNLGVGVRYTSDTGSIFDYVCCQGHEKEFGRDADKILEIVKFLIEKDVKGLNGNLIYNLILTGARDGLVSGDTDELINYALNLECEWSVQLPFVKGSLLCGIIYDTHQYYLNSDIIPRIIARDPSLLNAKDSEGVHPLDLNNNNLGTEILLSYPKIEIDLDNDRIREAVIKKYSRGISATYDDGIETLQNENGENLAVILINFNCLRAFNKYKGDKKTKDFAYTLAKNLLAQSKDVCESLKLPEGIPENLYPKYAELVMYFTLFKTLSDSEVYDSFKNIADYPGTLIYQNTLNDLLEILSDVMASGTSIDSVEDIRKALRDMDHLQNALSQLEITEREVEDAAEKVQDQIKANVIAYAQKIEQDIKDMESCVRAITSIDSSLSEEQVENEKYELVKKLYTLCNIKTLGNIVDKVKELEDLRDNKIVTDDPEISKSLASLTRNNITSITDRLSAEEVSSMQSIFQHLPDPKKWIVDFVDGKKLFGSSRIDKFKCPNPILKTVLESVASMRSELFRNLMLECNESIPGFEEIFKSVLLPLDTSKYAVMQNIVNSQQGVVLFPSFEPGKCLFIPNNNRSIEEREHPDAKRIKVDSLGEASDMDLDI